ncbi:siderophore-iron reductase FhuF [Pseudomonas sp. No.117]
MKELLAELDQRFATLGMGHLQTFTDDPGLAPLEGEALWSAATLERIVTLYRYEYPGADRRALLSHWSKSYLEALLPSALVAALVLYRPLPLTLERLGVVLDAEGSVAQLVVHGEALSRPHNTPLYDGYQALLHDNLTPFVEHLAQHARLSSRALWGNVAGYLAWALRLLAEHGLLPPEHLQEALRLFSEPYFPDGQRNPIQRAYLFPEQLTGLGWRRVCCLRYCLPPLPYCAGCPLLKREAPNKATGS